jgi:hypothetical protein
MERAMGIEPMSEAWDPPGSRRWSTRAAKFRPEAEPFFIGNSLEDQTISKKRLLPASDVPRSDSATKIFCTTPD